MANFSQFLLFLPVLLFSLTLHEYAHAYIAKKAGDMTATDMGRLTLNPLAHIDPIGTILMPFLMFMYHIPLLGWARPVPINMRNIRDSRWLIWISLAGVCANFCLVIVFVLLLKALIVLGFAGSNSTTVFTEAVIDICVGFIQINMILGFFNLLPIPPLDGSKILFEVLGFWNIRPLRLFMFLDRFGFVVLMLLLWTGLFQILLTPVLWMLGLIFYFLTG